VIVKPGTVGEEGNMLRQVEGNSYDDHAKEEKEKRIEDEFFRGRQHV